MRTREVLMTYEQFLKLNHWTGKEAVAAMKQGDRLHFVRDHFLFRIAFWSGLRVTELCSLKWSDIDLSQGIIYVRRGKGDKHRDVILGKRAMSAINLYLNVRRKTLKDLPAEGYLDCPVFPSARHSYKHSMSRAGMHRRIKFWLAKAGIRAALSMHSLRHGYATQMNSEIEDVNSIKEQLGHSSLATTEKYLGLTPKAIAKIREAG